MIKSTTTVRRQRTHLTKAQIAEIANSLVLNKIEAFAGTAVSSFMVRVHTDHGRTPTEGERDMFLEALSKIIGSLAKKKTKRP